MSARWFRFYIEALDDPKVQTLDGDTFKAWVNVLTLAAKHDGKLPPMSDIAFALRCDITVAERYIERLSNGGLIDRLNGGANGYHYAPHNWGKRQYKSDTSTDRVKRFRKRSNPVAETAPDTEADTEVPSTKVEGAAPDADTQFWANAKAYLAPHVKGDPGRLIGKWIKDSGKECAARSIGEAQVNRVVDPVSYISRLVHRQGVEFSDGPSIC